MHHRRSVTHAALAAGFALLLGACAAGTTDTEMSGTVGAADGSEPIGAAEEEDNRDLPAVPLPYMTEIHLTHDLTSRPFVVHPPLHASISVKVAATWSRPSDCHAALKITMEHAESKMPIALDAIKLFRTDGKTDARSWQNLQPGEYYLRLEVPGSDPMRCKLNGALTIYLTSP